MEQYHTEEDQHWVDSDDDLMSFYLYIKPFVLPLII